MKLSIITINYNNKAGLEKTINSVMYQSWRDFEWIIIDGGSTDGSKEVIENLAKDPLSNISYWCSEKDKGIYNAMNKGIAKAKGEYLNFMNSGDCFYDNDTLLLFTRRIEFSADIYYGDSFYLDKNGNIGKELKLPDELTIDHYLKGGWINHQAAFIKRKLLQQRPYDEKYKIAGDSDFFLYQLCNHAKFEHIDAYIAVSEIPGLSGKDCSKETWYFIHKNIIMAFYGRVFPLIFDLYCLLRGYKI